MARVITVLFHEIAWISTIFTTAADPTGTVEVQGTGTIQLPLGQRGRNA